jgi:fermentation-respiration switch protein FrsA (DUF1100 family)
LRELLVEKFFFYPDSINHGGNPKRDYPDYSNIWICSQPDVHLSGWFIPSYGMRPKGTVIHYHGNASNITNHWYLVDWIPKIGFNLLTFDYRGFGRSEGSPDFTGVLQDCLSVISFLRQSELEKTGNIILLGQSIGGAFCLSAASKALGDDIKGIIIDSSFDSFQEMSLEKIPALSSKFGRFIVKTLVSDKCSPILHIDRLTMPKLFIHGDRDQVVPFNRGLSLFRSALKPKTFLKIPNGTHMSIFQNRQEKNMKIVTDFFDSCV